MTHQARAAAVVVAELGARSAAAAEEIVWKALVEASNDELARRREVEAARDRAMRLQAALEMRNEQLEDWMEKLLEILGTGEELPGIEALRRAQQLVEEYELSMGLAG